MTVVCTAAVKLWTGKKFLRVWEKNGKMGKMDTTWGHGIFSG